MRRAGDITGLPVLTPSCCPLEVAWGRLPSSWIRDASRRGRREYLASYLTPEPPWQAEDGHLTVEVWEGHGDEQGKTRLNHDLRQQNPRPGHFRRGKRTGERKQAWDFPAELCQNRAEREDPGAPCRHRRGMGAGSPEH